MGPSDTGMGYRIRTPKTSALTKMIRVLKSTG